MTSSRADAASSPPSESEGSEGLPPGKLARPLDAGLYLVATPIGNARDITLRALDVLKMADIVACEDTRTTGKLLAIHGVRASLLPYHDHNAERQRPLLLERLKKGETVALVSDAGTPLVSDPGFKLVKEAIAAGHRVFPVPGASAMLAALSVAGLPTDRFAFLGFPPPKAAARRRWLGEAAAFPGTLIFYESPQRLAESLADAAAALGDRPAAVARELTKLFEETRRERLSALAAHYAEAGPPKGEVAVVVGPPEEKAASADDLDAMLKDALARGLGVKDAAAEAALRLGVARKEAYSRALALAKEE
ncbi:MAG: 16S rRNA (cytidine(1402)-2'-O)-methyltransferase [Alphaproteobacteria bacterium]|nr:16S rRNA (cytidine(1402)-2'-O)-methyltransferase [Alphaproteobacteria bacterium]